MRSYEVCFDEVFGSALSAALWFGLFVCEVLDFFGFGVYSTLLSMRHSTIVGMEA